MKVSIKFEPRDLWIGAYWTGDLRDFDNEKLVETTHWKVYVCLVPCLPVIFSFSTEKPYHKVYRHRMREEAEWRRKQN